MYTPVVAKGRPHLPRGIFNKPHLSPLHVRERDLVFDGNQREQLQKGAEPAQAPSSSHISTAAGPFLAIRKPEATRLVQLVYLFLPVFVFCSARICAKYSAREVLKVQGLRERERERERERARF